MAQSTVHLVAVANPGSMSTFASDDSGVIEWQVLPFRRLSYHYVIQWGVKKCVALHMILLQTKWLYVHMHTTGRRSIGPEWPRV